MKTNKSVLKLILDGAMLVVIALMYKKSIISLEFHEIAGLIVLGATLIHVLINYKWVAGITLRLFNRTLPMKTRFQYFFDLLLIIDVILLLISSFKISRIVLPASGDIRTWTTLHYFYSALLITLIGIHFGLHFMNIKNRILGKNQLNKAASTLFWFCAIVLVGFGLYSLTTTSFVQYLTGVVNSTTETFGHGMGRGGGLGRGRGLHGLGEAFNPTSLALLFFSYFSIIFTIGLATHGLTLIKRRPKKRLQLACQQVNTTEYV